MNRIDLQTAYQEALKTRGFQRIQRTITPIGRTTSPLWEAHVRSSEQADLLLTLTLKAHEQAADQHYINRVTSLYNGAVTFTGYEAGKPLTLSPSRYTRDIEHAPFTDPRLLTRDPMIVVQPVFQPELLK